MKPLTLTATTGPTLLRPLPVPSPANPQVGPRPGATGALASADRFITHMKAFGGILTDYGHAMKSGAWINPPVLTVPLPQGSTQPAPHVRARGFKPAMQTAAELLWTYGKQIRMPTIAPEQEVVGYVTGVSNAPNQDGDFVMDVVPLPEYSHVLYVKGVARPHWGFPSNDTDTWQTAKGHALVLQSGAIHAEIKMDRHNAMRPFVNDVQRAILAGKTPVVSVTGRHTVDVYHAPYWVEIHPVHAGRIISLSGEGFPAPAPLPPGIKAPPEFQPPD